MFWEFRGEFTKGFLEKVTFGLTFEERLFMFGDEVKKTFQEKEKAWAQRLACRITGEEGGTAWYGTNIVH